MGNANGWLWLLLLGLLGWCVYWQVSENRRLNNQWNSNPELMRFAWVRSLQLLLALVVGSVLILAYDWQLGSARSEIESLAAANQRLEIAARKPVNVVVAPPVEQPAAPAPAPAPAPVVAAAKPTPSPIEQVYAPQGNSLDDIKKRYEDILVTHLFLNRCGKAGADDYATIINGMRQESVAVGAPDVARLQVNILTAATGSYNEIYRSSRCDDPSMANLQSQYQSYITSLKERFPLKK
jgi:hypothetical protein